MVMLMPMPGSSPSGYNGPQIDLTGWDMPKLPKGWRWEVTDRGGKPGIRFGGMIGYLAGNPCAVWLYASEYTLVDSEHDVQRSRRSVKLAAEAIVRRATGRAAVDNRFTAFATGDNK